MKICCEVGPRLDGNGHFLQIYQILHLWRDWETKGYLYTAMSHRISQLDKCDDYQNNRCVSYRHMNIKSYSIMRKTTRLKSAWGFGQTNSPLSTARVLIDAVGLCLLRVSEVWRLFAPDLRRWINSFSGSDFKPRLVYRTLYFCYFFTNFGQQFYTK